MGQQENSNEHLLANPGDPARDSTGCRQRSPGARVRIGHREIEDPFAVIGVVDMVLVSIIAVVFFKVPLVGDVLLPFFATLLYLLSALGIGLLISTVSKTQQEAFMSTFLVFMPTILLSGFMFPVRSMPEIFQWLTYLNPLRHYLEIIRGIFLKGVGLESLWFQHTALLVLGLALMATAMARFQKHVV